MATECVKVRWAGNPLRSIARSLVARSLPGRDYDEEVTFTFGVCRDPYTYYPSLYHYLVKRHLRDGLESWADITGKRRWHPWTRLEVAPLHSFEAFLDFMFETYPGYVTGLYWEYLPPEISFVARFESLAGDLAKIEPLARAGVPEMLGHKNRYDYELEWNPMYLRKMYELEMSALKRFGYERRPA